VLPFNFTDDAKWMDVAFGELQTLVADNGGASEVRQSLQRRVF
jgi:hypothetical protein